MSKKLSEMTLEELWSLFPIFLTEHKTYWTKWYSEEVEYLKSILRGVSYHHIGSTAINGIMAKPIIDILIVVDAEDNIKNVAHILEGQGYIVMSVSDNRISLNKGYTEKGFAERVFHIHIRLKGDTDEIYFRDYLNAHTDIAREYEQLKLSLAKKYEHDRDGYTNAKSEFVKKVMKLAKEK